MRIPPRTGILACFLMLSACSPYVYRDEVRGFASGVDNLNTAYTDSVTAVDSAARSSVRSKWIADRAPLRFSEGCIVGGTTPVPCAVHQASEPVPPDSPAQTQAKRGAGVLAALKDYAAALGRIVDAQDRAALDKATGELKAEVVGIAEQVGGAPVAARAGAITGLFNQIAASSLDTRRYQALRAGVVSADQDIAVLAPVAAKTLEVLRAERVRLTRQAAMEMQTAFGPALSEEQYRSRLLAFDAKVDEIHTLIGGDPRAAVDQMVKAHAQLRAALEDPTTQIGEVSRAVRAFVTEAKAVQKAFSPPALAGSVK